MAAGVLANVVICAVATNPCPVVSTSIVQAYLIDPLYQVQTDFQLVQSGIDWQAVYDAFGLSLLPFSVGIGVGLVVNVIRKLR